MTHPASTPRIDSIERTLELTASPERVWHAHGRYAIRIEAFEPMTRIVWRWARELETPLGDGPTTTVEWVLEPGPTGGTTLHLTESGFLTAHGRQQNVDGWKHELGELVSYLEG